MDSSGVSTFTKQSACPSSKSLLDYRLGRLAAEMAKLVQWHIEDCDFCWAEVNLLVHHNGQKGSKEDHRTPAMPMNLRVLAEALLASGKPRRQRLKRATR